MNFDRARLTKNLRHLMAVNGIESDTELANRAKMNQPTVSRILSSDSEPRLSNLMRIADVLGVEYWHLLNFDMTNPGDTAEQQEASYLLEKQATLSPNQIDLLRELISRLERVLLEHNRKLNSRQRAAAIAATFATCISQNINARDLNDELLLASVNTAIQSPNV